METGFFSNLYSFGQRVITPVVPLCSWIAIGTLFIVNYKSALAIRFLMEHLALIASTQAKMAIAYPNK